MPRRFFGCGQCRQRKVKCDGARPSCQRCLTYRVQCPGYESGYDGSDMLFVNQTQKVIRKAATKLSGIDAREKHTPGQRATWAEPINDACIPASIVSAAVSREQLFSGFLTRYLPSNDRGSLTSHYLFLDRMFELRVDTALLRMTIETICLAELGSVFGDERCLQEAQKRYITALSLLVEELNSNSGSLVRRQSRIDEILAAISLFVFCEFYSAIGLGVSTQSGCISHVNGANRYIESMGPSAVSSEFGRLIFLKQRSHSVSTALINRKALLYAQPQWLGFAQSIYPSDPYTGLYNVLVHIPGFLERSDQVRTDELGTTSKDAVTLLADLETALESCRTCAAQEAFRIVDVRGFEMFIGLCPDMLFQTVFDFESVVMCIIHQHCWIASVLLRLLLLDVYHSNTPEQQWTTDECIMETKRMIYVTATDFCRTIPYCYQPSVGAVARIGPYICCVVENYFAAFGHTAELGWIQLVRELFEEGQPGQVSSPNRVTEASAGRESVISTQMTPIRHRSQGDKRMLQLDSRNVEWKRHHDSMIGYKIVSRTLDAGLRLRFPSPAYTRATAKSHDLRADHNLRSL